jgi:replicative superfamily II helicase
MNKSLIIGVLIAIIVVGVLVWFFVFRETSVKGGIKIPEGAPKVKGEINDDVYVEIMARDAYQREKDLDGWISSNGWQKLLEEYKITQEEFDNFVSEAVKDKDRFQRLQERWYNRYLEIKAANQNQ